MHVTGLIG